METIVKRIKGIEYPSSLALTPKSREFIVDVDGYYKELGLDPNQKSWSKHEIKEQFRKLFKQKGHDRKLIEAYKTLTTEKRVSYDSFTRSVDRLLKEFVAGKKEINIELEPKNLELSFDSYAYFIDENTEENYELALEWMKIISLINHRRNNDSPVRVVLSNKFQTVQYKWGELVFVDASVQPDIELIAYFLLKDTKENWFLDFCKIVRNWG